MRTNDATVVRLTKRNHGIYEPEFRLPLAMYFAGLIPISLFWYGWSIERGAHYMVPIVGSTLYGFGMLGVFVLVQQYMVSQHFTYTVSSELTPYRSTLSASTLLQLWLLIAVLSPSLVPRFHSRALHCTTVWVWDLVTLSSELSRYHSLQFPGSF
jgi:hypothetical protein